MRISCTTILPLSMYAKIKMKHLLARVPTDYEIFQWKILWTRSLVIYCALIREKPSPYRSLQIKRQPLIKNKKQTSDRTRSVCKASHFSLDYSCPPRRDTGGGERTFILDPVTSCENENVKGNKRHACTYAHPKQPRDPPTHTRTHARKTPARSQTRYNNS